MNNYFEIEINTEFFEAEDETTYVDENTIIDYIVNVSVNKEGRNLEFEESDFKFINWSQNIEKEEEFLKEVKEAEKKYDDYYWSLRSLENMIKDHIEKRRIKEEEEAELWKDIDKFYGWDENTEW